MLRFLINRAVQSIVTMFLLLIVLFLPPRSSCDPVGLLVPPEGGAESIALVRKNLGLDRPYAVQFAVFLKNTLTGNLGTSLRARRPVFDLIVERLPSSIALA